MSRDTVSKTFGVAFVLCVVCAVLVSTASVALRDRQEKNKVLDLQKNILVAADLYDEDDPVDIEQTFADKIEIRIVDLATGEYVPVEELDPADYDQRKAAKDPAQGVTLDSDQDIARIKYLERRSLIYLYKEDGQVQQLILPVRGMGLWGQLYGFLALDKDLNTCRGLTYYEHKETPGLGGEVDNPNWKKQWTVDADDPAKHKLLFDATGKVAIKVKKGRVNNAIEAERLHQVDGLAGATITSNGVTHMMRFWLGEQGFGPYLTRLTAKGLD